MDTGPKREFRLAYYLGPVMWEVNRNKDVNILESLYISSYKWATDKIKTLPSRDLCSKRAPSCKFTEPLLFHGLQPWLNIPLLSITVFKIGASVHGWSPHPVLLAPSRVLYYQLPKTIGNGNIAAVKCR